MDIEKINVYGNVDFLKNPNILGGPRTLINNILTGFEQNNVEVDILGTNDNNPYVHLNGKISKEINKKINLSGPNVINHPTYDNYSIEYHDENKNYVLGSHWLIDTFKYFCPSSKCYFWEWGIDTNYWKPSFENSQKKDCFIYIKGSQNISIIEKIIQLLKNNGIENFHILVYGKYTREEFKKACDKSRFGIVFSNQESNPHFLLESFSMNVPCVVFQHKTHWIEECLGKINVNTCTNWNSSFGLELNKHEIKNDVYDKIIHLNNNIEKFNPRKIIEKDYNLKISAKRYLDILAEVIK